LQQGLKFSLWGPKTWAMDPKGSVDRHSGREKFFEIKDFLAATGQGGQRGAGVVIGVLPLFWSLSWPRPSTPTPFR
jgi:hypothetical protein